MAERFCHLVTASLAAIDRDAPACARAVAAALGQAVIELVVDGERVTVRGDGVRVAAAPAAPAAPAARAARAARAATSAGAIAGPARSDPPRVEVVTTGRALLALLAGRDELYPAILDGRVRVRAAPGDAERLFDALRRFVEGCARSRAAPALLADYQRTVEPAPDRRPA
jgi:hypothetical protein